MATAFYEPLGDDRYRSTEHTVGPWGPDSQHAGPPSALLARALEQVPSSLAGSAPGTITRISLDILGAVPIAELTVNTHTLRPGRNVELVQAELDAGGRTVLRAQAWRMRARELELPDAATGAPVDPVPDFSTEDEPFYDWSGGYLQAMQWRFVPGSPRGVGQGAVWARMRMPLVFDEEPSGLQRVLAVADSAVGSPTASTPRNGSPSTPSSRCTSRHPRPGNGSALPPSRGSTRWASAWRPPGSTAAPGWSGSARSRSMSRRVRSVGRSRSGRQR